MFFIVYRVHWLKARARAERWKEETILIPKEMDWVQNYFQNRQDEWSSRRSWAIAERKLGHTYYASEQVDMWGELHRLAKDSFTEVKKFNQYSNST
jgi:hypothetical protein